MIHDDALKCNIEDKNFDLIFIDAAKAQYINFFEKYKENHTEEEVEKLIASDKIVIAFTAPGVRVTLGECFNLESGTNVEGKMITALRKLGFDYVLDTTFGADMTIMEEAKELIERKKNGGVLPMFTSCCPSWVKYVENIHPEFTENLSTTKSPNAMMGSLIKTYFAKEKGIDPQNIITVGIVPCVSKKYESTKKEEKEEEYISIKINT